MPAFSFHRPRFLRFGRSRSTADACDDAGALPCPRPGPAEQVAPPQARLPVDFGGRPSSAPRSVTPTVILSSRDSVTIQRAPPSDDTHSAQAQQYLAPSPSPDGVATLSQQSFHSETTTPPAGPDSLQLRQQNGMFSNPHNFSVSGSTLVDGNIYVTNNIDTKISQFMEKLLKETIPGAASDSSARYPPPQCHPGTRLAVLERCLYFIANCTGKQKICWVVGSAGVGKSAIMQSVADSPNLPVTCYVSVFFSTNGRDDGTKAIITLCYQLAAKSGPYRQLIEREVARDPSLLQASMPVQFKKFIIEPFFHKSHLLNSPERILIIIDGLDECKKRGIQLELLRLISEFCISYPSSPLVWLIASRPEQQITSFFDRADVMPSYEKEEIQIDSDDSRADVERFLREKLEEIEGGSNSFDPHSKWPEEKDFWKLAEAAGGLFAYADTVIKYIGDLNVGMPVSQFSDVLKVIDNHPLTGIPQEEHPMALLDALYARILSNIPAKVIVHARKLVLALASRWDSVSYGSLTYTGRGSGTFVTLCNWLAMTPDEAYAAVNQLQSLLRTPRRDQAHLESLEPFHKSFIDYVSDCSRSNFFTDMDHEARQLQTECAFRVLTEAPDGIDFGYVDYEFLFGTCRRIPGTGDKISLTWPVDGRDKNMQLKLYKLAIGAIVEGVRKGDPAFMTEFCIRRLITGLRSYLPPLQKILLRQLFDDSRRHELMACGVLKQMPLKTIPGIATRCRDITLRFRHPAQAVAPGLSTVLDSVELQSHRLAREATRLSNPWKSSCRHRRKGEWEEGKDQNWITSILEQVVISAHRCNFCFQRFERHCESLTTHSPDHTVTVLFTCTGKCCVEFRFVDPDDGISEWTYWFWIVLSPEERKKYGSTV